MKLDNEHFWGYDPTKEEKHSLLDAEWEEYTTDSITINGEKYERKEDDPTTVKFYKGVKYIRISKRVLKLIENK